ncbi:hypothetical protein [Vibrio algicola]|uniref:Calcium-binding protein n=1 Tax=Vibrio algicola TaxID=2662262 RepID=A0A5Q0TIY8_9VIBR|nr:hypothetical protein [Vibrio algicola]
MLKKLIFIALVALAVWQFYNPSIEPEISKAKPTIASFFDMDTHSSNRRSHTKPHGIFECDNRQLCTEMTTQAEAAYFYQHCPNQKIALDPDGTPCGKYFE